jgi:hypothetical protein
VSKKDTIRFLYTIIVLRVLILCRADRYLYSPTYSILVPISSARRFKCFGTKRRSLNNDVDNFFGGFLRTGQASRPSYFWSSLFILCFLTIRETKSKSRSSLNSTQSAKVPIKQPRRSVTVYCTYYCRGQPSDQILSARHHILAMTNSSHILTASVVTPTKLHRDSAGRDDCAIMGASNKNNNAGSLHTRTEPPKTKQEPTRVFRCLSNTTTANSFSPISPDHRSRYVTSQQQQQRSSLKHMFQPPASSSAIGRKKTFYPRHDAQEAVGQTLAVQFLGCRLDRSSLFQQSLRRSKPCCGAVSAGSTCGKEEDCNGKRVHFKSIVSVVLVPSHREYSPTTKKTLWGSIKEIKAAAIRNTAEFIHDRCNWRKATEEDRMYRDTRNGTLIHPVHVQRYYAAVEAYQQKTKKQHRHQQEAATKEREAEEAETQLSHVSRKRARCCSPSPIRRPDSPTTPDYERHEAKRRRLHIHAPVPCRPIYYQQQQQPLFATQQENYFHYQQYPQRYSPCIYPVIFPHHPTSMSCPAMDTV